METVVIVVAILLLDLAIGIFMGKCMKDDPPPSRADSADFKRGA